MIDRLTLGETAYFYHLNSSLTNKFIEQLFINISRHKSGAYIAREIKKTSLTHTDLTYSLCIFKFKAKPNFLDIHGPEEEVKYAYLLIVEYSNMLIVNKKNISALNSFLKDYITDVEYTTISRLFLNDKSSFEKLSMLNMDISNNSVRKRNIEANDLKSSFSPIYSSKYIINNLRVKDNENRISLALNTSKINKLGKKVSIEDYFSWGIDIVNRIESFEFNESYLDNFSIPISNQEQLKELQPASILFLFNDLLEELESEEFEEVTYYMPEKNKERKLNFQKYLSEFDTYFEINFNIQNTNTYPILNSADKKLKIKKNKASITISSKKLKNIIIKFANKKINLLDYINQNQCFIITFSEIDYVYSNKKLFKDSKLLGNLTSFLEVLKPYVALKDINSEKGKYYLTATDFDTDSLFYFVENTLAPDVDYLFCDDLGNEFADFISITDSKSICYYHAKNGSSLLSASDFQIVIGQALKNIGNMHMSISDLERKLTRWEEKISDTNIPLKRIGDSVKKGGESFIRTINSPNSTKEIYIVVNFLSKSNLEVALDNLKHGRSCRHQTIQILWLLSSFISTCKELGIMVHITCLP
ncbi:TPA: hypothetical protein QCY24_003444 [Bacillus wiedmannii]|nr:hypothetical protein [Bacillus wiedmannii]